MKYAFLLVLVTLAGLAGCNSESAGEGSPAPSMDAKAGSRASFALVGDYLYSISGSSLQLFDITTPAQPNPWALVSLPWGIETLHPYGDHLLVGADDAVYILDNSDPANPQYVSQFNHARACDPVVAQDDIAYVTLRSNALCGAGASNQLDIPDIADKTRPTLIKSYAMQSPGGLAVDGQWLFVCDGVAGLKVYDKTDPKALILMDFRAGEACFDLIAQEGRLYVSLDDGLKQYDYSRMPMQPLSVLRTNSTVALPEMPR